MRDCDTFLRNNYFVKKIGVFGSTVRGKNKKTSDIDMLVEFSRPVGFFKFLELEEFLGKLTGRKIDLATRNAVKPVIRKDVLREVVYA